MRIAIYNDQDCEIGSFDTDRNYSCELPGADMIGPGIEALKATIAFLERNQERKSPFETFANRVIGDCAAAIEAIQPADSCAIPSPATPTAQQCITRTVMEVAAAVRHLRQIGDIEDEDIHVSVQPVPSKSEPSADCWFSVKIPAKNPKPRDPELTRVGTIMGAPLRRS